MLKGGFCVIVLLSVSAFAPASASPLRVGFYRSTCPSAEYLVRQTVSKALAKNPGLGAGLIRMHFHDCFVRGCDASVLLDTVPGQQGEKDHPANSPSLRGFEVIDEAKALIEARCPEKVSCADILTFAARDSAYILGGINFAVPAGRRDGRVSIFNEVTQNLPPPGFNAQQLRDNFARKGLSIDEMVILSGAHSIGVSHCSSFSTRLYSFNATHPQDPSMDRSFASYLQRRCPPPGSSRDSTVALDVVTPNCLDNRYYENLKNHRGLLTSDQTLYDSPLTASFVKKNANFGSNWAAKFGYATLKMGSIEVLTGNQGEIRTNCRVVKRNRPLPSLLPAVNV
ncbi:peroxidase 5-like [Aristolochia californica]|uniref:peroxidase 5-like n=1 Tax=Aristolochia californica TaxID=171875 RepID=UPI0035D67974